MVRITRILCVLFLFIILNFGCSYDPTIIYFVRHAEKDLSDTTENPPLTQEGKNRIEILNALLKNYSFDGVYSTKYDRNIQTVLPIARKSNQEIRIYEWYDWYEMIDEIAQTKSKNFLICGHGDNLIPMIERLKGLSPIPELGHHEHDKLFRVTLYADSTAVEMITY
ncbi:MAG: histidine phosphatase family protein [Crocinitomicaceae bacterium]|nr:histidine phosphatase family protein [Crocinitomicaceae bacterium]